jgi:hypothetical protein
MACRDLYKETVGLLNVNSEHDPPSKMLFKCIEFTFNNPTVSLV